MTQIGHSGPLARLAPVVRRLWHGAPPPDAPGRFVQVVGHRGSPQLRPENTIPSFKVAVDLGADAIETDVCVTQDGTFILWHDEDPDDAIARLRQAGAERGFVTPVVPAPESSLRRPVRELPLSAMRAHYGYRWWSSRVPEAEQARPIIPFALLEDLLGWLAYVPRLRDVYLDLKIECDRASEALRLVQVLRAHNARGTATTFHLLSTRVEVVALLLAELRSTPSPNIFVYPDFELPGALECAQDLGATHVSMGSRGQIWTGWCQELSEVVQARHEERIDRVVVWTFNDTARLSAVYKLGADAILTDEVPLASNLLGRSPTEAALIRQGLIRTGARPRGERGNEATVTCGPDRA